ncbi:MAG: hypothetical protein HYY21_06785 [Candidatus Tectomicrobia bacterium]|nr:hypothetical protein [Candidatus Tectomicrobia bacterium]
MLNIAQFRVHVIRPTLEGIGAHSRAAENLVLGTALQESGLSYLRQMDEGPALGLYQMEPATHDDIWENYLSFRPELRERVSAFLVPGQDRTLQLIWNLAYATAMCRTHYLRVPAPLPDADDILGLAEYWKLHYNTPQGRGRPEEFVRNFEEHAI